MKSIRDISDRCEEIGECWSWKQAVNSHGTPMTYHDGKCGVSVYRIAYCLPRELPLSAIAGLIVWPTCLVTRCCNPAHMRCATRQKFCDWRRQQGLTALTPQAIVKQTLEVRMRPTIKLSMDKARSIRAMRAEGATFDEIGRAHGVCGDMARKVVLNQNWRETALGASVFNL